MIYLSIEVIQFIIPILYHLIMYIYTYINLLDITQNVKVKQSKNVHKNTSKYVNFVS